MEFVFGMFYVFLGGEYECFCDVGVKFNGYVDVDDEIDEGDCIEGYVYYGYGVDDVDDGYDDCQGYYCGGEDGVEEDVGDDENDVDGGIEQGSGEIDDVGVLVKEDVKEIIREDIKVCVFVDVGGDVVGRGYGFDEVFLVVEGVMVGVEVIGWDGVVC